MGFGILEFNDSTNKLRFVFVGLDKKAHTWKSVDVDMSSDLNTNSQALSYAENDVFHVGSVHNTYGFLTDKQALTLKLEDDIESLIV